MLAAPAWATALVALAAGACNRGPEPKPAPPQAAPTAAAEGPAAPAAAEAPKPPAETPSAAPSAEPPTHAGGLRWNAQPPLVPRTPSSRMRAAELVVEGTEGPDEVVVTVFHFPGQGGSVQANLDRWLGQITPAGGKSPREAAAIDERKVGELKVTRVSLDGAYQASMGPMAPPGGAPRPDHRLLGAIAEGPQGPVFFKMVGPRAVVQGAEDAFDALIGSLAPEP